MSQTKKEIRLANWQDKVDKELLLQIRGKVFIEEQAVPKDLEWDGEDDSSEHFLYFLNDQAVACGRLLPNGQIGRMAVDKSCRNQNIGGELLQFILEHAKREGRAELFLHAQVSALNFYLRHGFKPYEERFMEAGIEHQAMKIDC